MALMSKLQASYFAGLIDGEGYIGILKIKKGNKKVWRSSREYHYCPVLKISMTDRDIITFLYQSFGGNFEIRKAYDTPDRKASESYCWTLKNKSSIEFLQKVYPYLRVKRKDAEILFKFSNLNNGAGNPVSNENWNNRDELYLQIRSLHTKKGSVRD